MDYIKEQSDTQPQPVRFHVSILVVMDYIKEPLPTDWIDRFSLSFNPCCDGLYKRTIGECYQLLYSLSFNPCCDGLYKRT